MSTNGLEVFETTLHKTHAWLKELNGELGGDRHDAYLALRATLQALRDRLPVSEAVDLAAQLPMLVRGFYYESWTPHNKPIKYHRAEFLDAVRARMAASALADDPEAVVRAVFRLLDHHVSEGEMQDVRELLPADIAQLG